MKTLASLKSWWRPLPVWLQAVTLIIGFPAWLFIAYCVLSGRAESGAAFVAFVMFATVAIVHIMFDRRNRRGNHESSGLDLSGGEH